MKIAVPITKNMLIDEHFGHCEAYNIYTISAANEIESVQTIDANQDCGCKSGIAVTLAERGVSLMLAGGIGGGAVNVLNSAGIKVVRGCEGDPIILIKKYLAGQIVDSGITCEHHEHHE